MAKVANVRGPVKHYASLMVNDVEVFGVATLVNGTGYLFVADGERKATLINYKDPNLMLFGRCDIADAQWTTDTSTGDLARLLGRVA